VDRAVELIRGEIRRITTEHVTDQELADNKTNFIGRLPSNESNEGVAGSILGIERYDLGLDYLRRYADLINAVTAEEVLAAAQHYLSPEIYALAIAGPPLPTAE
jgi:zinc protease